MSFPVVEVFLDGSPLVSFSAWGEVDPQDLYGQALEKACSRRGSPLQGRRLTFSLGDPEGPQLTMGQAVTAAQGHVDGLPKGRYTIHAELRQPATHESECSF